MTSVFPTPVSVAVIKIPRVLESWACRLVRRIVWDLAGCKKTIVASLEKQNSPLQDAQKVQTSHPPNPGAPKRALSRARVFRLLIPLLRGVAEAALYCAHRATTASSWGSASKKGTWPLPAPFFSILLEDSAITVPHLSRHIVELRQMQDSLGHFFS